MDIIFNLIKGVLSPVCEILPLYGTGISEALSGLNSTVVGKDCSLWYTAFALLGGLCSLIFILKEDFSEIFKAVLSKIRKEKKENDEIYLICAVSVVPAFLRLPARILFSFLSDGGIITVITLFLSAVFLILAEKTKTASDLQNINKADSVLAGVFRFLGFIPGFSGTGGMLFASALSGFSGEFIYKLILLSCVPVLVSEMAANIIPAFRISLDLWNVIGCVFALAGGIFGAYYSSAVLKKLITDKKYNVFSVILLIMTVLSLIIWMRG